MPPLRPMEDADANKSAAQRLRERIAGKKHGASGAPAAAAAKDGEGGAAAAGDVNGGAEGAEREEGGLPRQRRRTAADEDVSTAAEVAEVAAGAVEGADGDGQEGGGAMVVEEKDMGGGLAPEPVGDEDVGASADWTFAELQNMAVRPDGEGLGEEAEEAAAEGEGVEVSEEEALEALAGHVGPDEDGSEVEVSGGSCRGLVDKSHVHGSRGHVEARTRATAIGCEVHTVGGSSSLSL